MATFYDEHISSYCLTHLDTRIHPPFLIFLMAVHSFLMRACRLHCMPQKNERLKEKARSSFRLLQPMHGLVKFFMERLADKRGVKVKTVSKDALDALCEYDWPGNVRELMNVIERAMLLCRSHEIGMAELPNVFHGDTAAGLGPRGSGRQPWCEVDASER